MRVLYHHRTQGEEPESVHIAAIVDSLRALGHTVDIVGPTPGASKPRGKSLAGRIKDRLPRVVVELVQLAYNLKSIVALGLAAWGGKYDFIYERHALNNFAGLVVSRLTGLPLLLEVNTPYAFAWAKYYGLSLPRIANFLERVVLRRADHIFTVTHAQVPILEQIGAAASRITVCHNAIDPAQFDPARYPREALRAKLGLEGIVAGFVGTMNRWQGMSGFAEVVRRVAAANTDVRFLFVGSGEGRPELTRLLEAEGLSDRVKFVGRVPHAAIPEHLACMDIGLLLESNDYGSPMKIFEYWAMGNAVIAPRVAPVEEIMQDGEEGLMIERRNGTAMADCVLRLAADPGLRARLVESGRRRVLTQHTWRANAESIVAAFNRLRPGGQPHESQSRC